MSELDDIKKRAAERRIASELTGPLQVQQEQAEADLDRAIDIAEDALSEQARRYKEMVQLNEARSTWPPADDYAAKRLRALFPQLANAVWDSVRTFRHDEPEYESAEALLAEVDELTRRLVGRGHPEL